MIDIFKHEDNWQDIKDSTMNTIGKTTGKYPTSDWKRRLILSEHSPIRRMKFYWRWKDLKSCHVSEDMSPIEKQDKEGRFWDLFNGGKIQYCRYNLGYNEEAIKTLILRAMKKGFYEGVNLAMCYCEDCGYQQVEMTICPKCGSTLIIEIDRMNGLFRLHTSTWRNSL